MTNADQPWIANYPPLDAWLKKINARCHWQKAIGTKSAPSACVEHWEANGRVFVVLVYAKKQGWNIYTSHDGIAIEYTLADAERRLGIHAPSPQEENGEHLLGTNNVRSHP